MKGGNTHSLSNNQRLLTGLTLNAGNTAWEKKKFGRFWKGEGAVADVLHTVYEYFSKSKKLSLFFFFFLFVEFNRQLRKYIDRLKVYELLLQEF